MSPTERRPLLPRTNDVETDPSCDNRSIHSTYSSIDGTTQENGSNSGASSFSRGSTSCSVDRTPLLPKTNDIDFYPTPGNLTRRSTACSILPPSIYVRIRDGFAECFSWFLSPPGVTTLVVTGAITVAAAVGMAKEMKTLAPDEDCLHEGDPDLYGPGFRLGTYLQLFSTVVSYPLTLPTASRNWGNSVGSLTLSAALISCLWKTKYDVLDQPPVSFLCMALATQEIYESLIGFLHILKSHPAAFGSKRKRTEAQEVADWKVRVLAITRFLPFLFSGIVLVWIYWRTYIIHVPLEPLVPGEDPPGCQMVRATGIRWIHYGVIAFITMAVVFWAVYERKRGNELTFIRFCDRVLPHEGQPWSQFVSIVLNWILLVWTVYGTEVSIETTPLSGVGYNTIGDPGQVMGLVAGILSVLSSFYMWFEHFFPDFWNIDPVESVPVLNIGNGRALGKDAVSLSVSVLG